MRLVSTTQSLEVYLGEAISATQPQATFRYSEIVVATQAFVLESESRTNFNGVTVVPNVVSAPAANNERFIDGGVICNRDTIAHTVFVRINDNSTYYRQLTGYSVPAGWSLTYDGEEWTLSGGGSSSVLDAMPIGAEIDWPVDTPIPAGWFDTDGSAKDTTTYKALYDVIGYGHGGSGSNFNIPTRPVFGYGYKNKIINGSMELWQRGTSFAAIASNVYSADRFKYEKTSTAVHTVSRSTDVPTVAQCGRLFNYSLLADCTTADASVAAGDFVLINHPIEGYNFRQLAQQVFTLSFWVKATKTGTYCVAFRNSGTDRSYVAEYTVNATATWEKKTVIVTASPSAGTWAYTTGLGLHVSWTLMAGTTYQTTAGAWQTGNYIATSNQVNACDDTANDFRITGIQIEVGNVATDIEDIDAATLQAQCERYYEKSYAVSVNPGTAWTVANDQWLVYSGSSGWHLIVSLRNQKRTTPTIVLYDAPGTANKISAHTGANWANNYTPTNTYATANFIGAYLAAAYGLNFAYTADAEF